MGWCTEALVTVYFNKETFNSKHDVKYYINELESYIKQLKSKLLSLVMMTEPQKFCNEDYNPLLWLQNECYECIEELETATIKKHEAELVLDGWEDMHTPDGKAKNEPSEFDKLRRICGDYVVTENNND